MWRGPLAYGQATAVRTVVLIPITLDPTHPAPHRSGPPADRPGVQRHPPTRTAVCGGWSRSAGCSVFGSGDGTKRHVTAGADQPPGGVVARIAGGGGRGAVLGLAAHAATAEGGAAALADRHRRCRDPSRQAVVAVHDSSCWPGRGRSAAGLGRRTLVTPAGQAGGSLWSYHRCTARIALTQSLRNT